MVGLIVLSLGILFTPLAHANHSSLKGETNYEILYDMRGLQHLQIRQQEHFAQALPLLCKLSGTFYHAYGAGTGGKGWNLPYLPCDRTNRAIQARRWGLIGRKKERLASKRQVSKKPSPEKSPPERGFSHLYESHLYDLDTPILNLPTGSGGVDVWSLGDALESTAVFGSSGAGKTSGSGKTLAHAKLKAGFSFLVLCAKTDEKHTWMQYCRDCGREKDVIVFSVDSEHRFNFLNYLYSLPDTQTEDVVQLIARANEYLEGGQEKSGSDPFWKRGQDEIIRNLTDFLGLATGGISLSDMMRILSSAPQSSEEVDMAEWQENSFLYETGMKMSDPDFQKLNPVQQRDYDLSVDFWLNSFAEQEPRTRSGLVSGLRSVLDGFNRGAMYELFSTDTTFTPEQLFEGKIIICDLPIKKHGQLGIVGQGILKYLVQRAIEARDIEKYPRPVCIWADESQYFVNSYDSIFQSTARSKRGCSVYLTQNISNIYASIGGSHPLFSTDALLGNFQTLIFHANRDAKTNQWASENISRGFKSMTNVSSQQGSQQTHGQNTSAGASISQQRHYYVEPSDFTYGLRNGGKRNDYIVDAVLVKTARLFEDTSMHYRYVSFDQRI